MTKDFISKGLGWKPQLGDYRDIKFVDMVMERVHTLPTIISHRLTIDWRYDQKHTNACTAYSSGSAFRFLLRQMKLPDMDPSKLFIYFNERYIESTPKKDATKKDEGAYLRDGVKALTTYGACSEADWPSDDPKKLTVYPTPAAYEAAKKDIVKAYMAVDQDHESLRQCLALGFPFIFGITVFRSMMTVDVMNNKGIVPFPGTVILPPDTSKDPKFHGKTEDRPIGGHALLCTGYNDEKEQYEFLNSWGRDWGDDGFGYLPYDFMENIMLAGDIWALKGM
jgi:C1A family cysteine protease